MWVALVLVPLLTKTWLWIKEGIFYFQMYAGGKYISNLTHTRPIKPIGLKIDTKKPRNITGKVVGKLPTATLYLLLLQIVKKWIFPVLFKIFLGNCWTKAEWKEQFKARKGEEAKSSKKLIFIFCRRVFTFSQEVQSWTNILGHLLNEIHKSHFFHIMHSLSPFPLMECWF